MKSEKSKEQHWLEGGLSLKAVSNILDIPTSTLRYWDKEGLVAFNRNWQNDYRQVSVNTLLELLDVLDYREMDVPIGKIKQIPQMTTNDLSQLLAENRAVLQGKIAKLEQTLAKIDLKEQALARLKELEQTEPHWFTAKCR
ncbi:MerR family transcriptional regulator [Mannheimia sp. AT1]|uniref:MerR family transcriptional regulator n=1 Tax=Mannheimia cairinae TaxID=3025936 RepID=A0ABT5MV25_9PAST|nr:MerR family transcriptional regulator [Mannheimia cairinae]MDD0824752.1 MerR family transcriptional regulator [Mannheimia cairinae]MDD0826319.1 MerR family transcriptional regulator [Mannheimia cairinae]